MEKSLTVRLTLLLWCYVARREWNVKVCGRLACFQFLLSLCWLWEVFESTVACKCRLQTANQYVERARGRGTAGGSALQLHLRLPTGGFCFSRSLIGGFSLQSWCVQGSIGSAEGSVLPSSDREQCGKIVGGYEGSTKTSKLLSEKAHKS